MKARKLPWGRIAIALVILNEVRGLAVVASIVTAWWQAGAPLSL